MRTVILIPARGGSKGISQKNITNFLGRPLVCHAVNILYELEPPCEIWISTDDDNVKNAVLDMNLTGVYCIDRPKELATDEATTESAMFHFAREIAFDIIVLVQCTSPMIRVSDINRGISMVEKGEFDSVFSGTRMHQFVWKGSEHMIPVTLDIFNRPRRQELYKDQYYIKETGAFYIITRKEMFKSKNRLGGRIGCVGVPYWTSFEVDTPEDLAVMEKIAEVVKL